MRKMKEDHMRDGGPENLALEEDEECASDCDDSDPENEIVRSEEQSPNYSKSDVGNDTSEIKLEEREKEELSLET